MAAGIQYYGTGRRKTATARVFLRPGNGGLIINRKPIEQAFPTAAHRTQIRQPFVVTETGEKFVNEKPKSPWRALPSQVKYRWYHG